MRAGVSSYLGLTCSAILLASLLPDVSDAAGRRADTVPPATVAIKGARLKMPRAAAHLDVASLRRDERHGLSSVTMRTKAGAIAYHADDSASTTMVAKNVVLPPVPERMVAPPLVQTGTIAPIAPMSSEARGKPPVGCESSISVLVKLSATPRPGLCLS